MTEDPMIVAMFGNKEQREKKAAKMRENLDALIDKGVIEFHACNGREGRTKHGYIKSHVFNMFDRESQNEILETIEYYFGSKSYWWNSKNGVEFYENTSVYPPGKRPWQWCGETVLFGDWKEREEKNAELISQFKLGDKVYFMDGDERIEGIVGGMRKRVTVIVPGSKWYVPANQLRKVE